MRARAGCADGDRQGGWQDADLCAVGVKLCAFAKGVLIMLEMGMGCKRGKGIGKRKGNGGDSGGKGEKGRTIPQRQVKGIYVRSGGDIRLEGL